MFLFHHVQNCQTGVVCQDINCPKSAESRQSRVGCTWRDWGFSHYPRTLSLATEMHKMCSRFVPFLWILSHFYGTLSIELTGKLSCNDLYRPFKIFLKLISQTWHSGQDRRVREKTYIGVFDPIYVFFFLQTLLAANGCL